TTIRITKLNNSFILMLSKIRKLRMNKYLLTLLAAANLFTLSSTHGMQQDKPCMQLQVITEPTQNLFSPLDELTIKYALKTDNLKLFLKIVRKIDYPTFTEDMMFGKMVKYDQILRITMPTKNKNSLFYKSKIKNNIRYNLVSYIYKYIKKCDLQTEHDYKIIESNKTYVMQNTNYIWYKNHIPLLFRLIYNIEKSTLNANSTAIEKLCDAIKKSFNLKEGCAIKPQLSELQLQFTLEFCAEIIELLEEKDDLKPIKESEYNQNFYE
ncbi:MAG: hypothetical protein ABH827_04455, partial [bacterium]